MKAKTTRPYKRKTVYINKDFQRSFIMKFCLTAILGSILAMGLVYWLAMNSTTVGIQDGRIAVHTTANYLFPLMVQTVLLEVIIVSVATIGLTTLFSFRIAGPIHRLKMMLYCLSQGDLSAQMNLRQEDQLKDVAQAYNEAIHALDEKMKSLKKSSTVEELKKQLEQFKTS